MAFTGARLLPVESVEEPFSVVLVRVSLGTVPCLFLPLLCYLRVLGMLLLLVWLVRSGGFFQNGAFVVLVEVLPGPASVASAVLLAAVFSLMVCVLWSLGLCILVKVLPRIALCRFWRRFFPGVLCVRFGPPLCCPCGLKCAVRLGCILVRFSQDGSWRFLAEVLPKAALHCWSRCCALGRVFGRCIGQLVSLVVSKFLHYAGGTLCVPVARMA
ncbi:hypothetical protein Taro_044907 [Colocasia esculenta]|uniref:Uncharacterized protein n=1 Tax=Colocasia esculenta TaxID=4460 RepID=A0A843WPW7_COLES|nr:hypothetical protein [Colocasia esculenta]